MHKATTTICESHKTFRKGRPIIFAIRRPNKLFISPNDLLHTSHRGLTPLSPFSVPPPKFIRSSSEREAGSNEGASVEEAEKAKDKQKTGNKKEDISHALSYDKDYPILSGFFLPGSTGLAIDSRIWVSASIFFIR